VSRLNLGALATARARELGLIGDDLFETLEDCSTASCSLV